MLLTVCLLLVFVDRRVFAKYYIRHNVNNTKILFGVVDIVSYIVNTVSFVVDMCMYSDITKTTYLQGVVYYW